MEDLILQRFLQELPPLLSLSGMFLLAKFLFLHLTLALVVYRDACGQERCAMDVPPPLWGFMVAVSPILGMLVYWLMHHSVLIRTSEPVQQQVLPLARSIPVSGPLSRSARVARIRSRRSPEQPLVPAD
jgi:hypothetical protein